jgi:hypothetical protein
VAGGFGGRGAPLHARTRAGPGSARGSTAFETAGAAAGRPPDEVEEGGECPARHCWVTSPVDGGTPRPGLLLEWRRAEHGWEGRVAYAAELRAERWAAVEEWLPADAVAAVVERDARPPAHRIEGRPGPA